MKLKRLAGFAIAAMMMLSAVGCSSSSSSSSSAAPSGSSASKSTGGEKVSTGEKVKVKIANIYGADTYESQALNKFKELVESKSEDITVEVYTNAQLGNEETLADSVRQGSVEIAVIGPMMAQYIPLVAVSEYPFLVDNWENANKVLRSDEFMEMTTAGAAEQGVEVMGYNAIGFRAISSTKEISKYEDLKGLRIRTPNIPYYIKMAECWGCNVVSMSLSELFTALEQKVVDAQENPMNVVIANKFYEVQPYVIVTRHMLCCHAWYANKKFMDGLNDENRKIIEESIAEAIDYEWEITEAGEADEKGHLEENGIKVTEVSEEMYQQMKDSEGPMTEWFIETYPGSDKVLDYAAEVCAE